MRKERDIIITLTAWVQAYEQHYRQVHKMEPPLELMNAAEEGENYVENTPR